MKSIIQEFIKNYKPGFKPYGLNIFKPYEIGTFFVEYEDDFLVRKFETMHKEFSKKFDSKLIEDFQHPVINLASTSKPFLIRLLIQALMSSGKYNTLSEVSFKVDKSFIDEMLMRKERNRILTKEIYNSVKDIVKVHSDAKSDKVDYPSEEFPEVDLPFSEICYAALKLSSNRAIEIVRKYLNELIGNVEEVQKFLEISGIAPTYEIHQGGTLYWEQPGANTGELEEIVWSFNNLANEIIESIDKNDLKSKLLQQMLISMSNNPRYFDTSYTYRLNSLSRLNKNILLLEKTGIMWPVAWGEKLSKIGYPPHLVVGTIASIVKNNKSHTFGHFKVIALAIPKDFDSEEFFNLDQKNYKNYLNIVKYAYLPDYINEQITIINSLLGSGTISFFQKFRVTFAMRLRRIYYVIKFYRGL